jgi:monoamine oxidase
MYARLRARFGTKISSAERRSRVQRKINRLDEHFAETDALRALRARQPVLRRRPDVIIVGAGFAGLMAGYTLATSCNVTVYEARNRVGGRVCSRNLDNRILETGGELIGFDHPLWLKLARQFNLGLSILSSDANFEALHLETPIYLDGKKLSERRMETLYEEMTGAFNKMSRQAKAIDNPFKPWRAPRAEKLDNMPLSEWISKLDCKPLTQLALEEQFSNDGGAPTAQQSTLANLAVVAGAAIKGHYNDFFNKTEDLRCSEGNDALARCLRDAIREAGGKVELYSPVSAIDVGEDKVSVKLNSGGGPFTADYAVLAIPPNLWPGNSTAKIAISPELSRDYHVTMGTAVKFLSPVKQRFWIEDGLAPSGTSDQFGVTWEGTDNQIGRHNAALNLFAGGAVAKAALRAYDKGGQAGARAFYKRRINRVYKGYGANCELDTEFVAWPRDEWTAGGYSCPAPGEVFRAGQLLSKPFHKRMFFAGEHTCPAYYGYMEGALNSGKAAAAKILKLMRAHTSRGAGARR